MGLAYTVFCVRIECIPPLGASNKGGWGNMLFSR